MNTKTADLLEGLKQDSLTFLNYLRAKFPVFHNSNFFYRDFEYGIKSFFEKKGSPLNYAETENITMKFLEHLEAQNVLIRTGSQAWKVNYPEFATAKPGDPF